MKDEKVDGKICDEIKIERKISEWN